MCKGRWGPGVFEAGGAQGQPGEVRSYTEGRILLEVGRCVHIPRQKGGESVLGGGRLLLLVHARLCGADQPLD